MKNGPKVKHILNDIFKAKIPKNEKWDALIFAIKTKTH